jgi:hypothetical protein
MTQEDRKAASSRRWGGGADTGRCKAAQETEADIYPAEGGSPEPGRVPKWHRAMLAR